MAEADGAAVDVEGLAGDFSERPGQAEHLVTERLRGEGGEAGEHLDGECLVDLPQVDGGHPIRPQPCEERRTGEHGPEAHQGGIEGRPLTVHHARQRLEPVLGDGLLGGEQQEAGAVAHLGAVARRHLPPGRLEDGRQGGEARLIGVRPHPVVGLEQSAVGGHRRRHLAGQAPLSLGAG
ncbi:MAG: hypothetical protein KatS3mg124_0210 [Porticoccaceae bacterium]|nr:MAG: hypothetical protein KatS3mg124_0210 [Porticoccaceae bacterium]